MKGGTGHGAGLDRRAPTVVTLHAAVVSWSLALSALVFNLTGCGLTPDIYTMPPEQLERIRPDQGIIGVAVSDHAAKQQVLMPAKGASGGLTRGMAAGAALPIAVGFVSPVPGGTALGILVSPITAVAGAVYGAARAAPAEQVEQAEVEIELAVEALRAMHLRHLLMSEVVKLGSQRTGLSFVPIPDIAPPDLDEPAHYDQLNLPGVPALLEIRAQRTGLRGLYGLDPPTSVFIELGVRLVRTGDNQVLLSETISCASEGRRRYVEWAGQAGKQIVDEVVACLPELAEKIVDDFFLVHPIASW